MAFSITYYRPHDAPHPAGCNQVNNPQQTEWITPEGWSTDRAKSSFEARHIGVTVLSCEPIDGI